ncbi:MAG: V-type ATPase 116kDa subunit family protein [Candidatus Helarchaeota archaeon]
MFPKKYYNEIILKIGQLGFSQLINQDKGEFAKQKELALLPEFVSLSDRVNQLFSKLKITPSNKVDFSPKEFKIDELDSILSEYKKRIDIIERELNDIVEIEAIVEKDLEEIIEKEKQYRELTNNALKDTKFSFLLEDKTRFEKDLEDLAKKYYDEILLYKKNLAFIIPYLNASQNITHTKFFSIISCWVISKRLDEFEREIQKITSNKCIIFKEEPVKKKETEEQEQPPTYIKHSRLLEPFIRLVKLYGIHNYYEIDPTIILAITFPLFFGLMFGDIGQGLVLMIGSGIIALITKRTIPKILFYCGLGAIFGGFLYGEFFGFYLPNIVPSFKPLLPFPNQGYFFAIRYEGLVDNIEFMLEIAIFIGYLQLSLGLFIQFANYYKIGKKTEAWLISIPSFFILSGTVFNLFYHGFHISKYFSPSPLLLGLPPITLIIVPLIILLIGMPIASIKNKEKKKSSIIGESLLRTWEIGLSILTNLPSYARIFALIMIHWGLNEAFQAIGNVFNNIFFYAFFFGVGNAFTILLEAIIVSAHALRLHFYEWFSKFYQGDGTEIKLFKLPKDTNLYELNVQNVR